MLEPGTLLQDRYKIVAPIGKGGMGAVYQARDLRLRCDVALKETFFHDRAYLRAFELEAQILARLRHQALPRVIDHFAEGNGQFLVMEFIHGEDLGNQLSRLGRRFASRQVLPLVLRWADQLLDALHYLHTRPSPVIHRDIKPKNLKLTQSYDIILLDFGLARGGMTVSAAEDEVPARTERKIYGFTPPYAPLEQMRDGEPDPRSDLYALGATLYHLLTGALPADAMNRMTMQIDGKPDPLKPISELAPHVPAAVEQVVLQAMSLSLEARPRSARAMRTDLAVARGLARPGAADPARPAPAPGAVGSSPAPSEPTTTPQPASEPQVSTISPGPARDPQASTPAPAGTLLRMLTTGSPIRSVAFSPGGEMLAAGYDDHTVGMWRLSDFSHLSTLRGHTSSVRSVQFSPSGRLLATASDDETVRLWSNADGSFLRMLKVPGCPIESIAFSPDGSLIAVGGWGSSIAICGVEGDSLAVLDSLPSPFVHSLAFNAEGSLLNVGAYDGSVYLWRVSDHQPDEPLSGFSSFILCVACDPTGRLLAASSNNSVRVWRMEDRRLIERLDGHGGPVHSLAFSPDGSLLATASEDRSVRLWNTTDGSLKTTLEHRAGVASLAFSPDGGTLATGSHDGRIYLWAIRAQ